MALITIIPLMDNAWAASRRAHPPARSARAPAPTATPAYGQREDVQQFAAAIARAQPQLDPAWVAATLAAARFQPSVTRYIMPAGSPAARVTAPNWAAYRDRFVEPRRIRGGLAFWATHEPWLVKAQQRWGVPPEIVVAILGIETLYGQQTGGFRAVDALATLSFDFPSGRSDRSAFFRNELTQLLVLAARDGMDPLTLRSSYAGAMGLPQFMPSTWLRHAVDFDADGRTDLHGSVPDVVGSVASYLRHHGWQAGRPTHFEVVPPASETDLAVLLAPDILPSFTPAEFAQRGAQLPPAARQHGGLLALVALQNGDAAPSFVAGTDNFWAITRYNWSAYYAMAVIDLAQALRQARTESGPTS